MLSDVRLRRWAHPTGEVMALDELELHLHGTDLAPGELTFDGLGALASALQQLSRRLGRHLAGQEGPGRTAGAVDRATELRLRGLSPGSTVLGVAIGEADVLGDGLEHRTVDRIFEVCAAIAADRPPAWTTALIGAATVDVIEALSRVSTRCTVRDVSGLHTEVRIEPRSASRSVWPVLQPTREQLQDVSVSGRLDLVDLRRSRFRLRDSAGNDIGLESVANAAEAAPLVGGLVTASGVAELGARGQILSLTGARVTATVLPGWAPPKPLDLAAVEAPPTGGVAGVGHDEVTEFLAMIRE